MSERGYAAQETDCISPLRDIRPQDDRASDDSVQRLKRPAEWPAIIAPAMTESLPREVSKPWGSELWYAQTDRYAGKILRVNAGQRLSVQYHVKKDETSLLLSGRAKISQGASQEQLQEREIGPGDAWRNEPNVVHTIEAIEDSVVLEVSTPELDDVVRLDD